METRVLLLALIAFWATITNADNEINTAIKMATESVNDMECTAKIYGKIKNEQAVLAGLKNSMRRQLRTKTSQFLANILCGGESIHLKRTIKEHVVVFYEDNETQLVDDILHDAISEVLQCKAPSQLVDILWGLNQEGHQSSFELMIRSELQLFQVWMDNTKNVADLKFLRKFAYTLYKMKQAELYQSVSASLKQQIDNLISTKLPANLQYLLFYPYFCLMSVKYSEYIYTCMTKGNIDSTSRYIWTWHEKMHMRYDTGHIKAAVFESNTSSNADVLVQLKGIQYDLYYYLMPQTKLIAGWELASEPVNYIWSMEFIDNDRVAFYQGDYIMCATNEMFDSERRQVRGYNRGNYTVNSSDCQWLLGKCNRK